MIKLDQTEHDDSVETEDEQQRALAREIEEVMDKIRSSAEQFASINDPRFEVIDSNMEGCSRPAHWIYAGNSIFSVDKQVLEELKTGTLTDITNTVGKTMEKEIIIGCLKYHVNRAKRNIKATLGESE